MQKEKTLARMNEAAREGREAFFKVADTLHLQPKYADKLAELETIKQQWRDMTNMENYPEIDFPLALPEWFPKVKFFSNFKASHIADMEAREAEREARIAKHIAELKAAREAELEAQREAETEAQHEDETEVQHEGETAAAETTVE